MTHAITKDAFATEDTEVRQARAGATAALVDRLLKVLKWCDAHDVLLADALEDAEALLLAEVDPQPRGFLPRAHDAEQRSARREPPGRATDDADFAERTALQSAPSDDADFAERTALQSAPSVKSADKNPPSEAEEPR